MKQHLQRAFQQLLSVPLRILSTPVGERLLAHRAARRQAPAEPSPVAVPSEPRPVVADRGRRSSDDRPNFLVVVMDEARYPSCYENAELRAFRRRHLFVQDWLREHGVEFHAHYAAATACAPSRASLFTGHYPSLHGVTQTNGLAKSALDKEMVWLRPQTVPTMGDYFRAAGYRSFYKGKWHVSDADILEGDGDEGLPTYDSKGNMLADNVKRYLQADRLNPFGFSEWIGPEPHGRSRLNTGTVRDPGFCQQTLDLLDRLEAERLTSPTDASPWLIVSSFVNPHDIALWGIPWLAYDIPFTDGSVPHIPAPPTGDEDLSTKPACQQSYVATCAEMLPPQPTIDLYRQSYFYLQKLVNEQMRRIYERLQASPFFEDTIVIFTSDHGDLLGAHGGMVQKWHTAYEEAIHVPLVISNPRMFDGFREVQSLTSHVDVLPTMLGLIGADPHTLQSALQRTHTKAAPLVGRDLTSLALGRSPSAGPEQAIYFMTDDEISRGQHQKNPLFGWEYDAVCAPNHVESVLATIPAAGREELWKFSRYFDSPEFWSSPDTEDKTRHGGRMIVKRAPVADQYEMYCLSRDPLEQNNLAHASNASPSANTIRQTLSDLLEQQRSTKRLYR